MRTCLHAPSEIRTHNSNFRMTQDSDQNKTTYSCLAGVYNTKVAYGSHHSLSTDLPHTSRGFP